MLSTQDGCTNEEFMEQDPFFCPEAKYLDMSLMDINVQDVELVQLKDQIQAKNSSQDMLENMFPAHIAAKLKAGEKVCPWKCYLQPY